MFKSLNYVLEPQNYDAWKNIPPKQRVQTASKILRNVQSSGFKLACNNSDLINRPISLDNDNLALQAFGFENGELDRQFKFPLNLTKISSKSQAYFSSSIDLKTLFKPTCGGFTLSGEFTIR